MKHLERDENAYASGRQAASMRFIKRETKKPKTVQINKIENTRAKNFIQGDSKVATFELPLPPH